VIEEIVERGGDADDVLRAVVAALGERYESVAIAFVEDGELVVGPTHGPRPERSTAVPIAFDGSKVAELQVAPETGDVAPLQRVAELVAPYCLVGWDTGGVAWDDM